MLCKLFLLLSAVLCIPQYDYSDYKISNSFLDASQISPQNYSNYLTVALDYNLLLPVIERLNQTFGPLRSRSEAHITVISPPEFLNGLSTVLSIDDINSLALAENLQSTPFTITCLGHQSQFDKKLGKRSSVYNLIIKADGLVDFRLKVYDMYLQKGGDPSNFNPTGFFPHVTLAFQEHGDWFAEDFVFKTDKTCIQQIEMIQ